MNRKQVNYPALGLYVIYAATFNKWSKMLGAFDEAMSRLSGIIVNHCPPTAKVLRNLVLLEPR